MNDKVTLRISFKNKLIASSKIQYENPNKKIRRIGSRKNIELDTYTQINIESGEIQTKCGSSILERW